MTDYIMHCKNSVIVKNCCQTAAVRGVYTCTLVYIARQSQVIYWVIAEGRYYIDHVNCADNDKCCSGQQATTSMLNLKVRTIVLTTPTAAVDFDLSAATTCCHPSWKSVLRRSWNCTSAWCYTSNGTQRLWMSVGRWYERDDCRRKTSSPKVETLYYSGVEVTQLVYG